MHNTGTFNFICRSSKDGLCNGLKIREFPIVTGGRHEIMGSHVPRWRMGFANLLEGFDFLWLHENMPLNPNPVIGPGWSPEKLSPILRGGTNKLNGLACTLEASLPCKETEMGSSPTGSTKNYGFIAQFGRAPALQAGGCDFEYHWIHENLGLSTTLVKSLDLQSGKPGAAPGSPIKYYAHIDHVR